MKASFTWVCVSVLFLTLAVHAEKKESLAAKNRGNNRAKHEEDNIQPIPYIPNDINALLKVIQKMVKELEQKEAARRKSIYELRLR